MTEDDFMRVRNTLQLVVMTAREGATDKELADFIADCERAMSTGPLLDPVAFIAGQQQLQYVLGHARAWQEFRKAIKPPPRPVS